jgi:hypothetical protein
MMFLPILTSTIHTLTSTMLEALSHVWILQQRGATIKTGLKQEAAGKQQREAYRELPRTSSNAPHQPVAGAKAHVFPFVKLTSPMARCAFGYIAPFASQRGLQPLRRDHARFFCQPMGYVEFGLDINLIDGLAVRYPREGHDGVTEAMFIADAAKFSRLKQIIESDAFKGVPAETSAWGFDGCSYFIEADVKGTYSWKCHWGCRDQVLLELARLFQELS